MGLNIEELDILEPEPKKKFAAVSSLVVNPSRLKIPQKDKIYFFSNLSRLLAGGVPILRAFDLTFKQSKSNDFKNVIQRIRLFVREGQTLSQSFKSFPDIFGTFEVSITKAGELSGTLPEALARLSAELKQQEGIKSKVWEAITYPLFVLSMGIVTLFVVLFFVVPRLSLIYQDFGGKLPFITQLVITAGHWAPTALILFGVLTVYTLMALRKDKDSFFRKIPFLSDLAKNLDLMRLSLLLSTLLKSGIPIHEAVSILMESMPGKSGELEKLKEDISQGRNVSDSFRHIGFITENDRSILLAGEESGTLPKAFQEIAESASEEFSSKTRSLLKILEPVMILMIGLVVGFLVISMLLPITQLDILAGE